MYSVIIRNDTILEGSAHDRRIYIKSEKYRIAQDYFTGNEGAIAETSSQGKGDKTSSHSEIIKVEASRTVER